MVARLETCEKPPTDFLETGRVVPRLYFGKGVYYGPHLELRLISHQYDSPNQNPTSERV